MDSSSPHVWTLDDSAYRETKPGFRRRVLTGRDLMLTFWRIRGGEGPTPYEDHPNNEQFGVILAGQLDFRIGSDERQLLKPGDAYWAPKGFPHGDSKFIGDENHGETWILDVFAPPREEYRNG